VNPAPDQGIVAWINEAANPEERAHRKNLAFAKVYGDKTGLAQTTPEFSRGFSEGLEMAQLRQEDPTLDLRYRLIGETSEFIRGFSAGLAAAR
jgi:hypothetical protein